MEFFAPAKINLYLNVLSKQEDGYHEIETVFERISIHDRISVEPSSSATKIICDDPQIPTDEDGLMGRVIKAFKKETGRELNFTVKIEKRIPVGAGLGGGSSDAATLLRAVNEMSGFPLDNEALLKISRRMGADIPFFLNGASFAFGKGRGDRIRKVETNLKLWHVIVSPPFQLSTKDVYNRVAQFGLTNNRGVDKIFTAFLCSENVEKIAKNLHNSLQQIALRVFPVLKKVLSEMKNAGAKGVLLSGSGPTVYGIFEREEAERAKRNLLKVFSPEEGWKVLEAHTC